MPTQPVSACCLSYQVAGDGKIRVELSYDPVKELGDMPEFGVMFKLKADYDRIKWYGLGPEESYADRKEEQNLEFFRVRQRTAWRDMRCPRSAEREKGCWAEVTDQKGRGMVLRWKRAMANAVFCASLHTSRAGKCHASL